MNTLPRGYEYPFGAALIREYLRQGHRVTVVTSTCDVTEKAEHFQGERLSVWATPRRKHYVFCRDAYAKERLSMTTALRSCDADVIHAQWCYEFAHAAMSSGKPYLVTVRDSPTAIASTMPSPYRWYRYMYARWLLPKLTHLSTLSPYMRSELRKRHGLMDIPVIPNGVATDCYTEPRAAVRHKDAPIITTVADSGARKNVNSLVHAFLNLRSIIPGARLVLIGPGLGRADDFAQRYNGRAHNIFFEGKLPHSRVLEALQTRTDIYAHTSLEESFGMSVAEAMAAGLPVVAGHNSGAMHWVTDNGNAGTLVDCRRPASISAALHELVVNDAAYARASLAAFTWCRRAFSLDSVANMYVDALTAIASSDRVTQPL